MPGLPRRSYTSYDVYRDYNSDDLLNDIYPADGAVSPRQDGADTPAQYDRATPDYRYTAVPDRYTPVNGHQTPPPSRPKSCTIRPLGRPASRINASMQTSSITKRRPSSVVDLFCPPNGQDCHHTNTDPRQAGTSYARQLEADTQRNYSMQDAMVRPTSPVQRLLDRTHTQPFISLQGPLPGSEMDPITRQYYHRKWSASAPSTTDITLNRYGRAGGIWRHVRACVANTGTQLAFIDGTVKQEDNVFFPQYPQTSPYQNAPSYMKFRAQSAGRQQTAGRQQSAGRQQRVPAKKPAFNTATNKRAQGGFKYWYQEPKPVNLKTSLRLKARMVGQGY